MRNMSGELRGNMQSERVVLNCQWFKYVLSMLPLLCLFSDALENIKIPTESSLFCKYWVHSNCCDDHITSER